MKLLRIFPVENFSIEAIHKFIKYYYIHYGICEVQAAFDLIEILMLSEFIVHVTSRDL